MNTIEEIANVLRRVRSAVIFTHMRPDGDTLGSGMALHRALSILGAESEVVCEAPLPERFLRLDGMGEVKVRPTLDAEAYICVDTSDPARLGLLEQTYRAGARRRKLTVNIDHHISNTRYAQYNFVRGRASNCENILDLIGALGVPVKGELAEHLMLGMVTDSGAFSHGDVNGDTFRAAACACDGGADVGRISYEMLKRQSKARAALYAEVIGGLRYLQDDILGVAVVTQEALKKHGLGEDATEGFVDFALTVDCVEVSACLLEAKEGQYKVSLRSKGRVNVNEVARAFGGGGHTMASGCMLFGRLEEVLERLSYAVWQNAGNI